MNCEQVRLLIAGDPHTHYADVEEHLVHCSECSKLHDATVAFEALLMRALYLPAFPEIPGRSATRRGGALAAFPAANSSKTEPATFKRPRRWGVGIGLAAALVTGFLLWLAQPPATWAAEVMQHVAHEPDSWSQTAPLPAAVVHSTLRMIGIAGNARLLTVVYARNCDFLEHKIAHLVVLTRSGPVTVFIDPSRRWRATGTFRFGDMHEILMPLHGASLAILSQNETALREAAGILQAFANAGAA
jgi:hypothetical protein